MFDPSMADTGFMKQALLEARRGWGNVGAGALVGAVIVEDGNIVSRGHYEFFGGAHAEVNALKNLGRKPKRDATLYVTLEPCSSTGKTGPCTEAILESGLQHVVIGAIDPDKRHEGRGVDILRDAGLMVETGVLTKECEDLNLIFNHCAVHESPFLAAKTATTLDGKIATRTGHSKWITGETARADVMRWRHYFPTIAVGAGTVIADDPSLTSRSGAAVHCPTRFVFDRHLGTLTGMGRYRVYNDSFKDKTILVTQSGAEGVDGFRRHGIRVWNFSEREQAFWTAFTSRCIEEAVTAIYFEGGAGLLSDLIRYKQLHYLFSYRAPKFLADHEAKSFIGGRRVDTMGSAYTLTDVVHGSFDEDQLMRGFIDYS